MDRSGLLQLAFPAVRFHLFLSSLSARKFLKQIVSGLLYLHSHNILHRDLTLSNILLTDKMEVVSFHSFFFMFPVARNF